MHEKLQHQVIYIEKNYANVTFWPKEGSIAWFVAVGPSIVLLERHKNTMKNTYKLPQCACKDKKNPADANERT